MIQIVYKIHILEGNINGRFIRLQNRIYVATAKHLGLYNA